MIQFAKAVYSEYSLKFSILVKMLHNIFEHNTDYVIYSGVCFAACLPATVLHDLLRDKFRILETCPSAEEQVSSVLNNAVK